MGDGEGEGGAHQVDGVHHGKGQEESEGDGLKIIGNSSLVAPGALAHRMFLGAPDNFREISFFFSIRKEDNGEKRKEKREKRKECRF